MKSEWLFLVSIIIGVCVVIDALINLLIIGRLLIFLFLGPLSLIGRVMVHVHPIKLTKHIVLGTPPPAWSIFSNLILEIIDDTRLMVVQYLSMNISWVLYFPLWLKCTVGSLQVMVDCGVFLTLSHFYRRIFSTRILSYFGSVSVNCFASNMLLCISNFPFKLGLLPQTMFLYPANPWISQWRSQRLILVLPGYL